MGKGYYFYADPELRMPGRAGGFKLGDPNPKYVGHYRNWLELQFICKRTEGVHRFQAEKELVLCEKKLDWWSKRPGFSMKECLPGIQKAKREWEVSGIPDRWSR